MWHQEITDVEATTFHINLVIQLWVKNEEGEDKLYWDDADLDNPTSDSKHEIWKMCFLILTWSH